MSRSVDEPVIDDYPVRPDTITQGERPSRITGRTRTLISFSLVYFLYGCGISLNGVLYPGLARKNGLTTWMYASVIASSHFICVLFYPVACRIVSGVSIRNSVSVSVFVIGSCRILFGSLNLISKAESFLGISYAVQLVEGIGMSILLASTVVTVGSTETNQIWLFSLVVQSSITLGLSLGPIGGQAINNELGFDILFYIIGALIALTAVVTAAVLQEPEQQVTYTDMPIVYWMKNKRMAIYFCITFASFIYVGYLSVTLELIVKKLKLSSVYFSMMFSLSPLVYGLTFPGWDWLIKKGFNSVMMVLIGSLAITASLVLLGPASFTSLKTSLASVCGSLVLESLGIACKSSSVLDASEKDLRSQKLNSEIQRNLVLPTIFLLGATSGYFSGTLAGGIMDYYIGYKKATLPLFVIEVFTAVGAVIFAMNRNYVSDRRSAAAREDQPILNS